MQVDHLQSVMVELTAAATIQAEASGQRLLFEWGQNMMERLRGVWEQIEILDTLAYEDKVTAQVRTLEEATSSLWHLHHSLVASRRLLKRHQRSLRLSQRNDGKQTSAATPTPNGRYRHGRGRTQSSREKAK
jgi:hypothetical protein